MIAALRAILGAVLHIPGLGRWLERLGLTAAAYGKGRMDQRAADRLDDAEVENATLRRVAEAPETRADEVVVALRDRGRDL